MVDTTARPTSASARRRVRWVRRAGVLVVLGMLVLAASIAVELKGSKRIRRIEEAPVAPIAIVFGAGLAPKRTASAILAQRLDTAVMLYRRGVVKKLLLSGDSTSDRYHDEPGAMRRYAIERGVAEADLLTDPFGMSTYDSCWRAREVYGVQKALLVSQDFHLPRALYLAEKLGIDAFGVAADRSPSFRLNDELRELLSRSLAWGMAWVRPEPASGRTRK